MMGRFARVPMNWVPLGDGRSMLVPPSTQYPTTAGKWWHREGCGVDRIEWTGCTCEERKTQ